MPKEFHTSKHFNAALSIAKAAFKASSVFDGGKVDSPLLLLGLMYREVTKAMEIEEGVPTEYPPQLANSPFGVDEANRIEKLLESIRIPK